MKCSQYLWNYFQMNKDHPEYSNAQVQGELRLLLGDEKIVSDTDGAELSEREALSIYGRNQNMLREAFDLGSRKLFATVVEKQQMSDDEWQKAKLEAWAEAEAAQEAQEEPEEPEKSEEDCPACAVPGAEG